MRNFHALPNFGTNLEFIFFQNPEVLCKKSKYIELKWFLFKMGGTSVMAMVVRMKVLPQKRKELLQTVKGLIQRTRKQKGCISCHFHQDIEDEDAFILVDEWETQDKLDNHLGSDHFGVLVGAMNLLSEPTEIKFNTFSYTKGMGTLKAARGLNANNPNIRKEVRP
jgi:quinol monooxygenase YgiN